MRRGEEKRVYTMTDRSQAVSKTFRGKNGLSPTRTAFKWFGISRHGSEREHLLNAGFLSESWRIFAWLWECWFKEATSQQPLTGEMSPLRFADMLDLHGLGCCHQLLSKTARPPKWTTAKRSGFVTLLAWKPKGAMSRSAIVTCSSPDVTPETKDFTKPTTNGWGGEKKCFPVAFVNVPGTNKPRYSILFQIT